MKHKQLMDACSDWREFAEKFETLEAAWNACEQPDWLMWYARRKMTVEKAQFVRVATFCAERVLSIFEAKAWADNTCEETRKAAKAAYDAEKKAQCDEIRRLIPWQHEKQGGAQ